MPNGKPKTMTLNRLGEFGATKTATVKHIYYYIRCLDVWRSIECENECKRGAYEINGSGLIWNNNRNAYAPPSTYPLFISFYYYLMAKTLGNIRDLSIAIQMYYFVCLCMCPCAHMYI